MPPCKVTSIDVADCDLVSPPSEQEEEKVQRLQEDQIRNKDGNVAATAETDPILNGLYMATTYLCFSMVIWIMITPASWLFSRSRFHREVLIPYFEQQDIFFVVVPKSIITKYQDHDLIHFTHFVPAAIWAASIPFQLHPTWRNNHRKLHRLMGYIFLVSSLLVSLGVFIILKRKLTYENFFPDVEPNWTHHIQKPALAGMSLWFAYTALKAVRLARAKNIPLHKKWMYRHVASGIWIAAQRLVFIPIAIAYYKLTFQKPTQWAQREIFSVAAQVSWTLCICLGEYAYAHKQQAGSEIKMTAMKSKKLQ